jgi:hypothetical protein
MHNTGALQSGSSKAAPSGSGKKLGACCGFKESVRSTSVPFVFDLSNGANGPQFHSGFWKKCTYVRRLISLGSVRDAYFVD